MMCPGLSRHCDGFLTVLLTPLVMRALGLPLVALFTPLILAAQETPTERESARDVVRRLDSLEKSLDLPALVAKLTAANPARDQVVARAKELMDTELIALGDDITRH